LKKEPVNDLKKSLTEIENKITGLSELMKKSLFDSKVFANTAFITFRTQSEATKYLYQFPKTVLDHYFQQIKFFFMKYCCSSCTKPETLEITEKKIKLEVIRAPEPDDIIWQNLHYTYEERLTRYIIIHCISAFIVLGGFIVIYILSFYQVSFINYLDRNTG
jgi:hypothetical protein